MAGAHLDSWVASDGAVDNAAGSAVVMEAARILRAMNVRPKRTIRFALWSGEEQGLWGSLAYVDKYVATRAPLGDAQLDALPNNRTWRSRWPIQPRDGYDDLVAYFNIDNGSGRIRGINAEGNVAAVPIFVEFMGEALKDKPPEPFKAPANAKYASIRGIREAFRPGTEPAVSSAGLGAAATPSGPQPYDKVFGDGQVTGAPNAAAAVSPQPPPKKKDDLSDLF